MAQPDPALARLVERIRAAAAERQPLALRGGGTKDFYGGEPPPGVVPEVLDVRSLAGISSYEPSELVVTVRAGTALADLEAALADQGQCLAFEPPRFAPGGTVGGMVAAGLAGPARLAAGSVRDYLLGATMVNGRGEVLSFGGQVMKNVAGYDVSRVLAGSLGVLGLIAEVSLKVLPRPRAVATLRLELDAASAIRRTGELLGQPLPLNASAWWDGMLVLRLAGAEAAVQSALARIGGERVEPAMADPFWLGLRDHSDEFFVGAAKAVQSGAALWRLSVPAVTPPLKLSGEQLVEWGGAQRWICTSAPAATLREAAAAVGGHAVLFRAQDKSDGSFATPPPALLRIHRALKEQFDPAGIFNPGRLLPGL
jgi:glycolate oxidase FAD binding subunit